MPQSAAPDPQPTYASAFRCIGPQCEDICCGGWDIPVDKITYQKYRQFPAEKLGNLVAHFVTEREANPYETQFASIRMRPDGFCPFLDEDKLCGIQKEYGAALLSATCSIYPRSLAVVNGVLEGSLSLSCPEAARQVLLDEHSTEQPGNLLSGQFRTDNVFGIRQHFGLEAMFLPIRALFVKLLRDRSRPLWQRLLLLFSLCTRLDQVAPHDLPACARLLSLYRNALGQGSSAELDRLPPGIETRIQMAIVLSNHRCSEPNCGRRFQALFWDFIEGIGSAQSEGPGTDIHRFQQANLHYLDPLLAESPFLLENYLLNYVYQHLFPFGRTGTDRFIARTMTEEATLLIAQFSWMTTLLTGVAAHHREAFGKAHLITAVQSFTRDVEHVPHVSENALAFVHAGALADLPGLARLVQS